MLVRDRMQRPVVTIEADRPVREATALLARHRVRQLPVMRKGQVVGIVTLRDLHNAEPMNRRVATVMTAKPFTIAPDAAVDEAARVLRTYKIGALPVVEDDALVGIFSVSDALDALILLSGVSESSVRLVVADRAGSGSEARVRRAVERGRGELKWLHRAARTRPPLVHLRIAAGALDEVLAALEASGLEVVRVVAATRARRHRTRALRARPAPRS